MVVRSVINEARNKHRLHFKINSGLSSDTEGNRLFKSVAQQSGLKLDLTQMSREVITQLNNEVNAGCVHAYSDLHTSQGEHGEPLTEELVKASIEKSLTKLFEKKYLPVMQRISQMPQMNSQGAERLSQYIAHQMPPNVATELFGPVCDALLNKRDAECAFYRALPELLDAVEQTRNDPLENQKAKTRLYTELVKYGDGTRQHLSLIHI